MADGLFTAADDAVAPKPKEERRTKLYPYDSVAALMLEPFGESAVDSMSLEQRATNELPTTPIWQLRKRQTGGT